MSIAAVNNSTVTEFVNDKGNFDSFVNEWFKAIDKNGDGKLTSAQIRVGFEVFLRFGSEPEKIKENENVVKSIFERFDESRKGALDLKEFGSLMTEIMNAFARGIGASPVVVALGKDSLLSKAVQRELANKLS